MKIFYSLSNDSFYHGEFKDSYDKAGTWPDDANEVTEDEFIEFGLSSAPANKKRVFINNSFKWVDIETSSEDKKIAEVFWRNAELVRADYELNKVQDSDSKAVGSVADWRGYRKLLRSWPEASDFPSISNRPKAPDLI